MNVTEIVHKRYSTKKFNSTKKLTEEQIQKVKELLRFSPSSINSQPWHFVIAGTKEGKKRISKSTVGFNAYNGEKVLDASHVVVFCAKTDLTSDYFMQVIEREEQDGRFANEFMKQDQYKRRSSYINLHRYELKDLQHWMEKQVYLNMGMFLLGVASLGIDAVPMEGFDSKVLDEELGLREKGYTSIAIVSIGYHHKDDFNAILPKSRLSEEEIMTIL